MRRNQLGKRSILARIAALLALVAVGVAIYLVVMSFTEGDDEPKNDKKGRQKAAAPPTYTVATGDTLSGIAVETGIPAPKIERLNPELDSEALNAGQTLALR